MQEYEGYTAKQRYASLKITKAAIADGTIPKPHTCSLCGKTEGRIDYHNETYEDAVNGLTMICQGCHMIWHKMKSNPKSFYNRFVVTGNYKKLKQPRMIEKTEAFIKSYKPE